MFELLKNIICSFKEKRISIFTPDITSGIKFKNEIIIWLDSVKSDYSLNYTCYGNRVVITTSDKLGNKCNVFITFQIPSVLFGLNPDVIIISGVGYSAVEIKELSSFVEILKNRTEVYYFDILNGDKND